MYLKTLATWALMTGAAVAQHGPISVKVIVDTSKPGPQIDRNIYGQFAEHLGRGIYEGIWVGEDSQIPNIHGYRKDVVEALKRIHVPVLRWPGGCFADQYDWRDGIGPRDKRPTRVNAQWGGISESNAFGTHEFLDFAELIGAEPYISGNMGSMTPRDMDQWMEYMTSAEKSSLAEERRRNGREKPWRIKYFGLGNEVWGCGGMMRAEYAIDVTRRYAFFLNAPSGQELIKVASGPAGNLQGYEEFTDTFMKNARNLFGKFDFQALGLHYYTWTIAHGTVPAAKSSPATGFSEDKWANLLYSAVQMEPLIKTVSGIMDKYDPEKKIVLAVDEWGAWHAVEPGTPRSFLYQQSTLLDAEVAALTLNIFHRHTERVKLANLAQMVNVVHAMILTDKERILLTPTFHVFDLYQPFQDATPYPAVVSGAQYGFDGYSLPAVDVSAAKGKDGKLYVALVNLNPQQPAEVVTNLTGKASGRVLTGPEMDSHNTFEAPDSIRPVAFTGVSRAGKLTFQLPPRAVAVVKIE